MVSRARSKPRSTPLIAFPVFDDIRHRVIAWVDQLEEGGTDSMTRQLAETYFVLKRVTGSRRHQQLAEFLHHAILAVHRGEAPNARCILLTAMAAFGWPSPDHAGPL